MGSNFQCFHQYFGQRLHLPWHKLQVWSQKCLVKKGLNLNSPFQFSKNYFAQCGNFGIFLLSTQTFTWNQFSKAAILTVKEALQKCKNLLDQFFQLCWISSNQFWRLKNGQNWFHVKPEWQNYFQISTLLWNLSFRVWNSLFDKIWHL